MSQRRFREKRRLREAEMARQRLAAMGQVMEAQAGTMPVAHLAEQAGRMLAAQTAGETPAGRTEAGGTPAARAEAGKKPAVQQPWQAISGLTPEAEGRFSRSERRYAIRKLFKDFERRIREALGEHEKDAEREERTMFWTPLDTICIELGIARRKLSALTRELTGMSAQETIDRIRAENVKEQVKAKLEEKARADYARFFAEDEKTYRKNSVPVKWANPSCLSQEQLDREKREARAIAEAGITVRPASGWSGCANALLKRTWDARRLQPGIGWSERRGYAARQQFARELGFSSYQRLYRACLLCSGKTPMELEHAAAVELFEKVDGEFEKERERVKEEVLKG